MSNTPSKIRQEIRALIPPTIFFFIALHIVLLIRKLMLEGSGIPTKTSISIILASLILAKAVLIADLMPFINRYPEKPLIYNVVWKTFIYFIVSVIIHYSEILFEVWRHTGHFMLSAKKLWAHIIWPHFWAIQILLAVLLFMYCTMRELVRVIGAKKVAHIFFGTKLA